jgi:hypothetical protein
MFCFCSFVLFLFCFCFCLFFAVYVFFLLLFFLKDTNTIVVGNVHLMLEDGVSDARVPLYVRVCVLGTKQREREREREDGSCSHCINGVRV